VARVIQAIRGMNDVLPPETLLWSKIEELLRTIASQYGYKEIRFPIAESTDLFVRTIGEATDIVEKEMYTFKDRNNESITLRPEGTACCVRAGIEHGLLYNQIQRLFYLGPMFRHERPQKGRYRQFHQFGVEVYGLPGPDIDVEVLLLAARIWQKLNISDKLELQINSLGNAEARNAYRESLVAYCQKHFEQLDDDSKRRLVTNPLRILDSKNPEMQELLQAAPTLLNHLDKESQTHFNHVCSLLDAVGIKYKINPRLVRGLDYYNLTVFEWVTTELGAQGAVCAGGHYDTLVASMGGKATPAIGFALGLERLIALAQQSFPIAKQPLIYLVLLGDKTTSKGMQLAEQIRDQLAVAVEVNCNGGSLSTQLKRADKSGAEFALILGDTEMDHEEVIMKFLRSEREQAQVKNIALVAFLKEILTEK
jgi:histidyl-tRNA synthetase